MAQAHVGVRFRQVNVCRLAITLVLIAAVGLGVLPFSIEVPLLPAGQESACRFEPLDVCGAGDGSLGMLADTPLLLPTAVAVVAESVALPNPPEAPAALREGFAPGVYRPPRPSC